MKKGLSRYYEITDVLKSLGFDERKFRVEQMPKNSGQLENNECEADDEMWMYVRDKLLWEELEGWKAILICLDPFCIRCNFFHEHVIDPFWF